MRCKSSGLVRSVENYDARLHPAGLLVSVSIDVNTDIVFELQNILSLYKPHGNSDLNLEFKGEGGPFEIYNNCGSKSYYAVNLANGVENLMASPHSALVGCCSLGFSNVGSSLRGTGRISGFSTLQIPQSLCSTPFLQIVYKYSVLLLLCHVACLL